MKLKVVIPVILGLVAAVVSEEVPVSNNGVAEEKKDTGDKRFSSDNSQFNSFNGQDSGLVDWNNAFHKRFSGKEPRHFVSDGGDGKLVDWSKLFKRFGTQNGAQFGQDNSDKFMKWNSAFNKRFKANKDGFLDNDGKMVDWSSMYKRFGGTQADNSNLVDWSAMFQKNKRSKRSSSGFKRFRSGDMSFIPEDLRSGVLIDWSRVFSKRGFDGYNGAFGNRYTMQDWKNLLAKRNFGGQIGYFGHDGLNDYNLQNWNSLLDRKRRSAPQDGN